MATIVRDGMIKQYIDRMVWIAVKVNDDPAHLLWLRIQRALWSLAAFKDQARGRKRKISNQIHQKKRVMMLYTNITPTSNDALWSSTDEMRKRKKIQGKWRLTLSTNKNIF